MKFCSFHCSKKEIKRDLKTLNEFNFSAVQFCDQIISRCVGIEIMASGKKHCPIRNETNSFAGPINASDLCHNDRCFMS